MEAGLRSSWGTAGGDRRLASLRGQEDVKMANPGKKSRADAGGHGRDVSAHRGVPGLLATARSLEPVEGQLLPQRVQKEPALLTP